MAQRSGAAPAAGIAGGLAGRHSDSLRRAEAEKGMAKFARAPRRLFARDSLLASRMGRSQAMRRICKYRSNFLIVITCRDEKHQVELLERVQGEALERKALVG
jgi:hypothetical protein